MAQQQEARIKRGQLQHSIVTGFISFAELVSAEKSKSDSAFVSITIISTATTNGADIAYHWNTDDKQVVQQFEDGWLPAGRLVTVTGQVKDVQAHYTDKKGVLTALKRPIINLIQAQISDKGPMPKVDEEETATEPTKVAKASKATKPAKAAVDADSVDDQQDIPF